MEWFATINKLLLILVSCSAFISPVKNEVPFIWSPNCKIAFNLLHKALISAPVLAYPNLSLPFIIQTDASLYAAGAVLSQVSLDGIERPIAYCSQILHKHKCNYTVTERECLAVIFALKQFKAYIYGTKFEIVTDHASLSWLHNLKSQKDV